MRNCSTHNMNMSWTYLVQCNNTATHQNMPSCLLHVKPLHLHWVGRESHEKRIKFIRLGPYHETFLMLARNFVCFTLCRVYAAQIHSRQCHTDAHKHTHNTKDRKPICDCVFCARTMLTHTMTPVVSEIQTLPFNSGCTCTCMSEWLHYKHEPIHKHAYRLHMIKCQSPEYSKRNSSCE